jgi:hypothetical protein
MIGNLTYVAIGTVAGVLLCALALHLPQGDVAKAVAAYLERRVAALRGQRPPAA